ncbi:MAG TPA: hypothetical protein VK090_03015 [Paracoccaceae bacterium]|nr:hypothetical protein [Paracoccaceae bacterium]
MTQFERQIHCREQRSMDQETADLILDWMDAELACPQGVGQT